MDVRNPSPIHYVFLLLAGHSAGNFLLDFEVDVRLSSYWRIKAYLRFGA
jgi:hypothetical protein